MSSLPHPSADALGHSTRLAGLIRDEIASAGGWIGFDRYMDLALYAPGLGYYSAGMQKFGSGGDFVTAPEVSPLFGRCLARQIAQVLAVTGGDVLELGAGSGKLAVDVLKELERLGRLPERYHILEVSAFLRETQKLYINSHTDSHVAQRVCWLDELPEQFNGVVLGNEVLDALPVRLIVPGTEEIYERGVTWENDTFVWSDRVLGDEELRDAVSRFGLPSGYVCELGLVSRALMASLACMLGRGVILMLDYGFPAHEYYHPQRSRGTLMCHYRHHAHGDPFFHPGLQDITAHVDFSAMAMAASANDAELMGYTNQAQFLINCGLIDLLSEISPSHINYFPFAAQAQRLLSPAEMGELFKAIAVGKGIDVPLVGFAKGDKRHVL